MVGVVIKSIMNTVTFLLSGIFKSINTVQDDCREWYPEGCFAQAAHGWSTFLGSPLEVLLLLPFQEL